jgi:hypothetical protein
MKSDTDNKRGVFNLDDFTDQPISPPVPKSKAGARTGSVIGSVMGGEPHFKVVNPALINRSTTPDLGRPDPKTLQKQVFDVMNTASANTGPTISVINYNNPTINMNFSESKKGAFDSKLTSPSNLDFYESLNYAKQPVHSSAFSF